MSDVLVLNCVVSHNRPFNTQLVADLLATKGVKKPAAQRSLDALAAAGKLRVKEFGKAKIYYPNQDTVVLDKEELQVRRASTVDLNQELATIKQRAAADKKDLATLQSAQTVEQLEASVKSLKADVAGLEAQLQPLRTGKVTVSKKDNDTLEAALADYMSAWQRRKRMFNDVWGTMADSMPRKEADVFAEVGVETDDSVKASYRSYTDLLPKRRR